MKRLLGFALVCGSLSWAAVAGDAAQPIRVFAAASLVDVLQEIGGAIRIQRAPGSNFRSLPPPTLARQVENGAQADVFCAADQQWMDYLQQRGLIQPTTRHDLAGNRLALVAPADSAVQLQIHPGFALRSALKDGRLATGDTMSVPVGRYARAALTSLGVWHEVEDRLVLADDARKALVFVASGEAPLGIVRNRCAGREARAHRRPVPAGFAPADCLSRCADCHGPGARGRFRRLPGRPGRDRGLQEVRVFSARLTRGPLKAYLTALAAARANSPLS